MFVHTSLGRGRVIDEQSVRGRKSFLVEGSGFKVWIDEKDLRVANDVNDSNSTTLPYDPTPQHPTDMFADESTMQPINEVDADERLSPSNSLTFEDEGLDYPGPSPDNFAKEGGFMGDLLERLPAQEWDEDSIRDWVRRHDPDGPVAHEEEPINFVRESGRHEAPSDLEKLMDAYRYVGKHRADEPGLLLPEKGDFTANLFDALYNASSFPIPGITASNDSCCDEENYDDEDDLDIKHFSSRTAGGAMAGAMWEQFADHALPGMLEDAVERATTNNPGPGKKTDEPKKQEPEDDRGGIMGEVEDLADDFAGDQNKKQVGGYFPGRPDSQTITSSLYERPAGLSDKYVRVAAFVDHHSDPVQQFRDDPVGFIQKRGYMMSDSVDIRLAEYIDLVDHDPSIRTAAWKDVRSKALRLRREGRVHVKDIAPNRIYANVEGDSDTYETMIYKAGNNQSISDWHCSCPWGRWAFKRQMSYVGRLCSHGYASYLEMESQQMKDVNKKRRKSAGIVEDFKQWADNENDGMIDQQAIDNYIYLLNSMQEGDHTVVSEEDAEKLYDALDSMKSTGMVRDYNVDYLERPGDVYKDASFDKEADVLALRPQSLTPDFYFVEDGQDGQYWTDVTEDERKTTGPDNMVRSAGYFGDGQDNDWRDEGYYDDETEEGNQSGVKGLLRTLLSPHTASVQTRRLTGRELHYASDEELGQVVKDWAGTGSKLEKLRDLSAEDPDFQNMREKNNEIREVIDELHDRGIDAAQFVASLRFAADAEEDAAAEDDDKKKAPASEQQPDMSGKPSQTGQPGGSSSVPDAKSESTSSSSTTDDSAGTNSGSTPSSSASSSTPSGSSAQAGPTNALSNQTKDPASVGFNGGPATSTTPRRDETSTAMPSINIDPGEIMSTLGQAAGGFASAIPSMMYALPSIAQGVGQLGSGISSGLGNLMSGLGGITANQHTATPVGGFPNVQLTNQESFQGSGPNPKYWMGSSECYVDDHERERFVDVTDLADESLITYKGEKPKQGPKKSGSRRPFVASGISFRRDPDLASEGRAVHAYDGENLVGVMNWHPLTHEVERMETHPDYTHITPEMVAWTKENINPRLAPPRKRRSANSADSASVDNSNPETSTLNSGFGLNDSMVVNFDQVRKAGSNDRPWDGHRIRDFRRFVQQNGGQIGHQALQEYLSKPRRGLGQGSKQHLQEYVSYAEQHEPIGRQGNYHYAEAESADLGAADVPSAQDLMPDDPSVTGLLTTASYDDGSDIVANFHRMGGIEAINNSGGGGTYSDAAIAEQAKGFLRTAGRMYSLAEQRELENESHPKGARNLDELDLAGTHYEDAL